ncbi:MAG: carbohydrate kinase family protein [Peptostreptococcaceae bacterium]
MGRVICPGELLIDFVCVDIDSKLSESVNFIKKSGGAPANVAAAIAKLGANAEFVGKVGRDQFGDFLISEMLKYNVGMEHCLRDESNTTLAFVSLDSQGERDFNFVRGADEKLKVSDIDFNIFDDAQIIHLGSATALLGGELYTSYKEIIKYGKNLDKLISFDPNFRESLFGDKVDEFVERSIETIKDIDLIKVSMEEAKIITKLEDTDEILGKLHQYGAKTILMTLGKQGTVLSINGVRSDIESIKVNMIDSTGAGDAFIGSVLASLSKEKSARDASTDVELMKHIVKIANIVGAKTTENYGAIESIPRLEDLENI